MSDDAQTSKKSSCGVCYTAANNAVRVAAASSRDDFATLTMQCHHNALLKTHTAKKNRMAAAATTLARLPTAAAIDRHDTIADMMHDRVCPMLSSALELGKEKSDRPAAQRAHAVRDICSSLC